MLGVPKVSPGQLTLLLRSNPFARRRANAGISVVSRSLPSSHRTLKPLTQSGAQVTRASSVRSMENLFARVQQTVAIVVFVVGFPEE